MEGIEKVLKEIEKVRQEQVQRLELLYKHRQVLRERLGAYVQIQKVSTKDSLYNLPVGAVDSSYALQKNRLGSVEYYWVGVGMDLSEFYYTSDDFLSTVFAYQEDSLENAFLMQGIACTIEFSLAGRLAKVLRHVFLDGSFFTSYIHIRRAYAICQKHGGNSSLVRSFLSRYKETEQVLIDLLSSGSLCAFPKRSSFNELVDYISQKQNKSLPYRDAELVDVLLERGEYIEVSHLVDRKKLKDYLNFYARYGISQKVKEILLERFRLFYVKGAGGGVLRVEFFSEDRFPAEVIYSQNLSDTNELQLIIEMDRLAKSYLKLLLEPPNILGNYRLL